MALIWFSSEIKEGLAPVNSTIGKMHLKPRHFILLVIDGQFLSKYHPPSSRISYEVFTFEIGKQPDWTSSW